MKIKLPQYSLVVLIGTSGSGKSTFAQKHFLPTEVVCSDHCRAIVSDDENELDATNDAFDVLHFIVDKRLQRGKFTVVDATNVQSESRKPLVEIAKRHNFFPAAIILDVDEKICKQRNRERSDREFLPHVLGNQRQQLKKSLKRLKREGFRYIFHLNSAEKIAEAAIERQPLWNNRKHEHGPFDIIGDIHGCLDELCALLEKLGYQIAEDSEAELRYKVTPPTGRKALFVGDLVDRGPASPAVLRLVMSMVEDETALCVPGNHDVKLLRKLNGKNVNLKHGLAETMQQLEGESSEFIERVREFLDGLISHYVFDDGKLVVAHAGLKEQMQGRGSGAVRAFCLFGETTGETDEFGLPVRYNWAAEYKGAAMVVYGHTPIPQPEWLNNTINIDTGCVFGGRLTALRYPEKELVAVDALRQYSDPIRPIAPIEENSQLTAQQQVDDLLDIADYYGKFFVETRFRDITIREENAIAALEVMSRFAINPKWLIYLPPTMSPCETSELLEFLEHPSEAFRYYAKQQVSQVICEEKHMGSRAVVVIAKDEAAVRRHFGIEDEGVGTCYTRTGRSFFDDDEIAYQFLEKLRQVLTATNFWQELQTEWVCFDCELMPWSHKAQKLLETQYSAVTTTAHAALPQVIETLETVQQRGIDTSDHIAQFRQRQILLESYAQVYRRYCWPVDSVDDLKLAPFHILASEGCVHSDKPHLWHMQKIAALCQANPSLLQATRYQIIDSQDEASVAQGIEWWLQLTEEGKEGMVVKPGDFIAYNRKKLLQPAVKCRGREYLRITYGPEYTLPENIARLKNRFLKQKRSMAMREFCLGMEALERFVRREPLRRVHECVFGVLALESEPVDPRL